MTYNLGSSPEDNIIFYVVAFVGQDRVSPRVKTTAFIWKAHQTVFMVNTVLSLSLCVFRGKCASLVIFPFNGISGQMAIN